MMEYSNPRSCGLHSPSHPLTTYISCIFHASSPLHSSIEFFLFWGSYPSNMLWVCLIQQFLLSYYPGTVCFVLNYPCYAQPTSRPPYLSISSCFSLHSKLLRPLLSPLSFLAILFPFIPLHSLSLSFFLMLYCLFFFSLLPFLPLLILSLPSFCLMLSDPSILSLSQSSIPTSLPPPQLEHQNWP